MTEIALRQDGGLEPTALAPNAAVSALMDWAQSAQAAHTVAQSLVRTSFVPEGFRGKPDEATAAILAGIEVGLQPMAALRSFDVIQGTAAPRANTLRAIVQSQGHEVWVVESTETRAVVAGRRRGSAKDQTSIWTMDRAKRLGLTGKKNWQAQPQAMLVARATSELCRLIASDAILGLPYSIEELVDGDTIDQPATVTPMKSARRTARRSTAAAEPAVTVERVDAPAADVVPFDEPPLDDEPQQDPDAPSQQQTALMWVLLGQRYETEEDQREHLHTVIDRDWSSTKEFSRAEVSRVIDSLGGAS